MSTALVQDRATRRWLVGPRFDLTWFFGGAALGLLVVPGLFAAGVPIAALFWAWLLLVDGPHIGATLLRTYLDPEERRARPRLLAWSLLAFAAGPLAIGVGVATGSKDPFALFLAVSALYGFYHVVRQHYGFMALYGAIGRDGDARAARLDGWTLYVGCWAPYLYFMAVHPLARALVHLPPALGPLEAALAWGCVAAWVVALASFVVRRARAAAPSPTKTGYVLAALASYGVIYFGVARLEPVYPQARGPDEAFMLISVMTALFHGVQYVALVWVHERNRLAERASLARYVGLLTLFSLGLYLAAGAATGVFPGLHPWSEATLGPVSVNELGLSLWWGLALHHYVVDAYVWRVRGDRRLARNLGLSS